MFPKDGLNALYIKMKGLANPQNRKVSPSKQLCLGKPGIRRGAFLFL